jgi:hypothetical protein
MKVKLRKVKKGSRVYLSTDIFFGYVYNAEGKRVANRERKALSLNSIVYSLFTYSLSMLSFPTDFKYI